jgi:alginate O-acetyltransferase complex protein AlgI
LPQIKRKTVKDINWEESFKALVIGYFLKMVVADNLKDFTFWIDYPYFQGISSLTLITMLFGYPARFLLILVGIL